MNSSRLFTQFFLIGLISPLAQAALHDRGNGMVYDDALDITWLQNANYAKAEFAANPNRITEIIDAVNAQGGIANQALTPLDFKATGQMSWYGAMGWADQLVYGGFSDWRLPKTGQPDPSCEHQIPEQDLSFGYNCVGSELGHLFYVDFANLAPETHPLLTGNRISTSGVELKGIGVFHWSDRQSTIAPDESWFFNFQGYQATNSAGTLGYLAWGVRDGDVLPNLSISRARWMPGAGKLVVKGRLQYSSAFSAAKRSELRQSQQIIVVDAASDTPIALNVSVKRDNSFKAVFSVSNVAVPCSVKADFGGKQSAAIPVDNAPSYCAP